MSNETYNFTSPEFIADCLHWRGRALTGKYSHWCQEWDQLPVDETCGGEFSCCNCWENTAEFLEAKLLARTEFELRMAHLEEERKK